MTQHRVAEAKCARELVDGLLVALDVHENVVRLVDLGDGVGELPTAPVFLAMDAAVSGGDHALVAIDHRGDLLALVRMNQKYNLVVPHQSSLRFEGHPETRRCAGVARSKTGAQHTETHFRPQRAFVARNGHNSLGRKSFLALLPSRWRTAS